jgi:hypothetical protein
MADKKVTLPVDSLLKEKKIYQIVNPRLVQAPSSISAQDAVKLMQDNKAGYIVIADKKNPSGFLPKRM